MIITLCATVGTEVVDCLFSTKSAFMMGKTTYCQYITINIAVVAIFYIITVH